MFYFDSTFLLLLPAIIISMYAQQKIQNTFKKYSRVFSGGNYTGCDIARMILDKNDLEHISIEHVRGNLTDHYDPRSGVLRLSDSVYGNRSIAAYGVAAHEVGHAIQHSRKYMPLEIRNSMAPVVSFSSKIVWLVILLGFFLGIVGFIRIGVFLFLAVVIFQLVTLPVEFDASSRAIVQLESLGILYDDDIKGAKKVLNAAALTYVAAALIAVSQLIRLLILSGYGRRD